MREIELTKGQVALVDDEDYELLTRWQWHYSDTGYACRKVMLGRDEDGTKHFKTVRMHRQVMGAQGDAEVDHIDGNRLNNQKANLRLATRQENMQNSGLRSDNNSGYKGVAWSERDRRWRVTINKDGKQHHVGQYKDVKRAALAYDEAAREHFGEFARLNFPDITVYGPEPIPAPRVRKPGTSGYRGVQPHKDRWRVRVKYDGKMAFDAVFDDKEQAARKYDEVAKTLFGPDAILNFPD